MAVSRVVFDTNIVLSALLFRAGRLSWLRSHWQEGGCLPLICQATAKELMRVLGYPKFKLSIEYRTELLGLYVPYCETVEVSEKCPVACRDLLNQPLLDLAQSGIADLLITGDDDLLSMAGQTTFLIESPESYRRRVLSLT